MSETPESDEEIWESIRHTSMDELAQEIGRMCLYWSELEMTVSVFLSRLLKIEDRISSNVVIGALDFRTKLAAVLPLAFDRKPNPKWYDDVEKIINHIDNVLRPERNRIIHDAWVSFPDRTSHRLRIQGKVVNTQAFQKEIRLSDIRPFTPRDVGLLYAQMIRAGDAIRHLTFDDKPLPHKLSARPSPPKSPDRDRNR